MMIKKKFFLIPLLAVSILAQTVCGAVSAAAAPMESEEIVSEPTPNTDPHTPYYNKEITSNKIKGWPERPKVEAGAAILMDANTGAILYSKNAHEKLYPASITKIMTTALALQHCDLNDTVTFSEYAINHQDVDSTNIGGLIGEKMKVKDCFHAVMLASANEVSTAIAEKSCGSLKKFVDLMNQTAQQLGCTRTHFNNANGLPDENHYTTARDMALIARYAWRNPVFRRITSTLEYTIKPTNLYKEERYLYNHHKMISTTDYYYEGCLGGKTGYTIAAGNTLVTYAKKGHMTLICVVLQDQGTYTYTDTAALMDYGFDNFKNVKIADSGIQDTDLALDPLTRTAADYEQYEHPLFAYRGYFITVPNDIDMEKVYTKSVLIPSAAGDTKIRTNYLYKHNNWFLGSSTAYDEGKVLSFLVSAFS